MHRKHRLLGDKINLTQASPIGYKINASQGVAYYGTDADAVVIAKRDSNEIVANVAPTAPKTPAKIFSMVL